MFKFYNYLIFKIPILCIFSNKQKKKNSKKLKKTKAGNQKKPKEKMGHEEPKPFPDILDFVFCFQCVFNFVLAGSLMTWKSLWSFQDLFLEISSIRVAFILGWFSPIKMWPSWDLCWMSWVFNKDPSSDWLNSNVWTLVLCNLDPSSSSLLDLMEFYSVSV